MSTLLLMNIKRGIREMDQVKLWRAKKCHTLAI